MRSAGMPTRKPMAKPSAAETGQGEEEGPAVVDAEVGRHVRAQPEEEALPDRDLAAVPDDDHEADDRDAVGGDVRQVEDLVVLQPVRDPEDDRRPPARSRRPARAGARRALLDDDRPSYALDPLGAEQPFGSDEEHDHDHAEGDGEAQLGADEAEDRRDERLGQAHDEPADDRSRDAVEPTQAPPPRSRTAALSPSG